MATPELVKTGFKLKNNNSKRKKKSNRPYNIRKQIKIE